MEDSATLGSDTSSISGLQEAVRNVLPFHMCRNLSILILLIIYNIRPIIDLFDLSGLMIPHLLIQMQVSFLLKNCIQTPVIGPVYLFCCYHSGLSITSVSVFLHDPDWRYSLSAAVFFIDYPDDPNGFIVCYNEIVCCPYLVQCPEDEALFHTVAIVRTSTLQVGPLR